MELVILLTVNVLAAAPRATVPLELILSKVGVVPFKSTRYVDVELNVTFAVLRVPIPEPINPGPIVPPDETDVAPARVPVPLRVAVFATVIAPVPLHDPFHTRVPAVTVIVSVNVLAPVNVHCPVPSFIMDVAPDPESAINA